MTEPLLFEGNNGVTRGEGTSYIITNYLTKEKSTRVSVAVSEPDGKMWKTINRVSDRVYYFIKGKAKFIFENKTVEVNPGDVLFIPLNTPYSAEGKFKAVLINSPSFDVKNETRLD
jgi:mannose-6-phosphate isomerase-like protein (cupin superfamily)